MGELLGAVFRGIIEVIVEIILYIVVQVFVEVLVMPVLRYFFGRTRWFSPLYIGLAIFVGIQLYRSLLRMENPSANFYAIMTTVMILIIAPLLHERIQVVLGNQNQPTTSNEFYDEKPKR